VLTDLNPWVVSLHLVLSLAIVSLAVLFLHRLDHPPTPPATGVVPTLAWAAYGVTWAVLYAGTVVTGSGPHAGDASSPRNGLDPLQVSQFHADLVFLLIGLTVGLWFALRATGGDVRPVTALAAVEVMQAVVGFVQYFAGLPAWLVMGLSAGLFEFVPLIGPLTVAVLAALLATVHSGSFSAFLVLIFLGVLRIIQDYFIYPRLIGQGIHLHPMAVIFAILCGAELAGVAGILLAIPVVAILTVSYKHWLEHRGSEGLADLLETQPAAATPAKPIHQHDKHPDYDTTPEEMTRARPDLTTGELKMPTKE